MQISRLQTVSQVPQSPQTAPTTAERRTQEAPAATRPIQPEPSSSPAERLDALASAFGKRIEHLAVSGDLSAEQVDALQVAHQGFLQNLQRLSSAHESDAASSQSLNKGLAAAKQALQGAVHQALSQPSGDASKSAAERLGRVQQSVTQRLDNLLAAGDLSPRASSALEQVAAHFDSLFQRLGNAVDGGQLGSGAKAGEAFAAIMSGLGQSVHAILGASETPGIYSPTGEVTSDPMTGGQLEHLA